MINLPVIYSSQWDPDASEDHADDCGPTCIKMILNFYGGNYTINQIFEKTGATAGQLITFAQMFNAINSCGFKYEYLTGQTPQKLQSLLDKGVLAIALVHYGNLSSRQDQRYQGAHFVTPVGYRDDGYFVNDPDFWGSFRQDGDHHFFTKTDFETAWGNCKLDGNPNNSLLVIYPKVPVVLPTPTPVSTPPVQAPVETPAPVQPTPDPVVVPTPDPVITPTEELPTEPDVIPVEVPKIDILSVLRQIGAWLLKTFITG